MPTLISNPKNLKYKTDTMNTTDPTNGQLAAADLRKAAESLESAIGAPEGSFEEHLREQQARDAARADAPPPTDDALDLPSFLTSDTLDDDHHLWCVDAQIRGLLEGDGANEDHESVIHFLTETGLPKSTVARIHKAIVCAEVVPVKPTPTNEPTQSLKLGDGYDAALIGATITGHFAYSLTKLATIEADMRAISVEAAREIIAAQVVQVVREWGAGCPVFIDDSLVVPDSEVSRIIVPGSAQFPGVEVGGAQ